QHSGQHGEIERYLEKGEHPKNDDHIVEQRQHGTETELPLKAKGHVDQNTTQREQHAQATLVAQLLTHRRPDELDSLDAHRVGAVRAAQCISDALSQLGIVARHAHQHVCSRTEALHYSVAKTGLHQLPTHLLEFNRALIAELDQCAAS